MAGPFITSAAPLSPRSPGRRSTFATRRSPRSRTASFPALRISPVRLTITPHFATRIVAARTTSCSRTTPPAVSPGRTRSQPIHYSHHSVSTAAPLRRSRSTSVARPSTQASASLLQEVRISAASAVHKGDTTSVPTKPSSYSRLSRETINPLRVTPRSQQTSLSRLFRMTWGYPVKP